MRPNMRLNRMLITLVPLALAVPVFGPAGCVDPGRRTAPGRTASTQPSREEVLKGTETIVLRVVAYYQPPFRWITSADKTRIHGLVIGALYLEGPNRKGVFGNGIIHAKLSLRERDTPKAGDSYRLIKSWDFTPEDMYFWRTKKPTVQGNGYLLVLDWSDLDVDLGGREIRITIGYERSDGIHVPPSTKDLLVPGKGS
ncbi:MAG: hypothetical protein AMXMBFR83_21280 [Phycisphaerae bacterium]